MTYEARYHMHETNASFVRRFDVCDDFLDAVEQAENAREEGELLITVYAAPSPSRIVTPLDRFET